MAQIRVLYFAFEHAHLACDRHLRPCRCCLRLGTNCTRMPTSVLTAAWCPAIGRGMHLHILPLPSGISPCPTFHALPLLGTLRNLFQIMSASSAKQILVRSSLQLSSRISDIVFLFNWSRTPQPQTMAHTVSCTLTTASTSQLHPDNSFQRLHKHRPWPIQSAAP